MRSFPCATAGSRGCSTSDARRCLRGSTPSFPGPNGEGLCASHSRSAFRTRATVNTGVRQRSICGSWARSPRRSHGATASSLFLHTTRYTTRSAGLWTASPRVGATAPTQVGADSDRHSEGDESAASGQPDAHAPRNGVREDLLAPRGRRVSVSVGHPPVESPRGGRKVRPRGEKVKRGWGRPAQRSSDDEFSSLWPSELSPSLPSIGFLITRFWTIGAGALVGPGGDIGPRA